jgi:hypothetical protein
LVADDGFRKVNEFVIFGDWADAEAQKVVIPANGSAERPPDDWLQPDIQYAAAVAIEPQRLWNTG